MRKPLNLAYCRRQAAGANCSAVEPLVVSRTTVDECTMGHDAKKSAMIYTDMIDLEYAGSTGDSRCHNQCDAIAHHPDGPKRHGAAYVRMHKNLHDSYQPIGRQ